MANAEAISSFEHIEMGVILVDHGSRREESNAMLLEVVRDFALATGMPIVEPAHMDLAEWEKAQKALLATIDVDAKAFNAYFALGEVYLRQNKVVDAEKVLVQGLAIQDASYLGHLNLARVYWEKAREIKDLPLAKPALEKSYEEVKRALTLNPELAGAHLLKGNLLLRVSRTNDAVVEFTEYLRLEPNGPFAAETRALVEKISHNKAQNSQK